MENFLPLETERLLLRQIETKDLSDTLEHRIDPEVCRYIDEPMTAEQVMGFISKHSKPWKGDVNERLCIVIESKTSGKVIGELMFRYCEMLHNIGEIGFRLNRAFQKKGLAKEATACLFDALFEHTGLNKLVAYCAAENLNSYRLMESLGMKREGYLRQQMHLNHAWEDQLIYGLLKSEWSSSKKPMYQVANL